MYDCVSDQFSYGIWRPIWVVHNAACFTIAHHCSRARTCDPVCGVSDDLGKRSTRASNRTHPSSPSPNTTAEPSRSTLTKSRRQQVRRGPLGARLPAGAVVGRCRAQGCPPLKVFDWRRRGLPCAKEARRRRKCAHADWNRSGNSGGRQRPVLSQGLLGTHSVRLPRRILVGSGR